MLSNLFYIVFILYSLTFLSCFTGLKIAELFTCSGATLISLFMLVYMYHSSGNLPVFDIFESFLLVSFIMGASGLFVLFRGDFSGKVRRWVWAEILLLFLIMLFFPKEASASLYDRGYVYMVLFHMFRCIALALMLFSTAWFVQFIIQRELNERTSILAHQGRNYLVLYVGMIWCQNGWGDFWMWSKTFFQSTLVVFYLMLAFHIPGKSRKSEDIRCVIGGLSGVFFLTMVVVRNLF